MAVRVSIFLTLVVALAVAARAAGSPASAFPPAALASDHSASLSAAPDSWRTSIYWQNDGTFVKPNHHTDRHYTNGAEASFSYHPDWAKKLAGYIPFADQFNPSRTAAGFTFGQLIFTPENLQTKQPQPNDWPYSGYLFTSAFFQRSNAHTFDQIQLELGLVGPDALGQQVQNTVHRMRGFKTAKGWDNQLHNEVTGEIYLRRKWRFDLPPFKLGDQTVQWQIIPRAELDLGTVYRQAIGGAILRMGVNLPDDFGPGELHDIADFTGCRTRGFSAYAFVGVRGYAVQHNLFLQGNTFRSSLSVDPKPLVGAVQGGVSMAYTWRHWSANLVYGQTFLTKQFYGQNGTDAFGSLTLAVACRF